MLHNGTIHRATESEVHSSSTRPAYGAAGLTARAGYEEDEEVGLLPIAIFRSGRRPTSREPDPEGVVMLGIAKPVNDAVPTSGVLQVNVRLLWLPRTHSVIESLMLGCRKVRRHC